MKRLLLATAIALGIAATSTIAAAESRAQPGAATASASTQDTRAKAPKARKKKKSRYHTRRARLLPVVKAATPGNLPVGLVDAIITKESRYDVNARGSSGEIGLMQILPSTARRIARKLGHKSIAALPERKLRKHLTDPANNIRFGLTFLQTCHKMAKGDIAATVGCYNAGPKNMWRWHKIKITRAYVSFVRSHMAGDS